VTSFNVNPVALQQAVDDINRCHNAMVNQNADLKSFLTPLRATWVGQGGDNWDAMQRKWHDKADNVYEVLRSLHNALETGHSNYTVTERNIAGIWE
jgi:WXG100 family type VII secretion target